MLMNLGLNSPRIEQYSLLYPASTSLQKELCNYYSVVIDLCTKIIRFVRKPAVKQIASALRKPFEDEFGAFQKDLNRLGMVVKEEVSIASKKQQNLDSVEAARERKESSLFRATGKVFRRDAANEFAQMKKWREDRLRSRFFNSLSKHNHETAFSQARKKGASTWILDKDGYQEWVAKQKSWTMLCSGIVGSGKSVLSASVVEDLSLKKPTNSSLGYFFCRYDMAETLRAREVMGSLARQLLQNQPTRELSLDKLDHNSGDIDPNIDQIAQILLRVLPSDQQYFLVIDGIDECSEAEHIVLLKTLQYILESTKQIFKLFWTCRFDLVAKVSEKLRPDNQVNISPSCNAPGISNFIECALKEALESQRLKLRDPRIIVKIQEALENGAQGMSVTL